MVVNSREATQVDYQEGTQQLKEAQWAVLKSRGVHRGSGAPVGVELQVANNERGLSRSSFKDTQRKPFTI